MKRILALAGGALVLLLGGAAVAQSVAPGSSDLITPGVAGGGSMALVWGLLQLANRLLDGRRDKRNGGGTAVQVAALAAHQQSTATALVQAVATLRELRDTSRETHFAIRNEVIPRLARPHTGPPLIKGDPNA